MSYEERRVRELEDKLRNLYAWASWPLRWAWIMCLTDYNYGDRRQIHQAWKRYDELLGDFGELLSEQRAEFKRLFHQGMGFLLDQGYVDPVRVDRFDWPVIAQNFRNAAVDLAHARREYDRSLPPARPGQFTG